MKTFTLLLALTIALTSKGCSASNDVPVEQTIKFQSDDATLEGTLNLPGNSGKYPLAVFIHGSGMSTRSDYSEYVTPFLNKGIAVFRYDKRGVGASGGTYTDVGPMNSERMFNRLASDAVAAIRHLKNDKRIDGNKIILIGGSQAGWIIPEANTMINPWLLVCISGPSVTVGEEIYYSDLAERGAYSQEYADSVLKEFKGLKGFDPISRIEKMKAPSLWLFGGKDVSIPVKRTIYLLDSVKTTKHLPLEMKLYPDADHGLFNTTTRTREHCVTYIAEWIEKHK